MDETRVALVEAAERDLISVTGTADESGVFGGMLSAESRGGHARGAPRYRKFHVNGGRWRIPDVNTNG